MSWSIESSDQFIDKLDNLSYATIFSGHIVVGPIITSRSKKEAARFKQLLANANSDTSRVILKAQLAHAFLFIKPDSAITLCDEALAEARKIQFPKGEVMALNELGNGVRLRGDLPRSMQLSLRALEISKANNYREGMATSMVYLGSIYVQLKEHKQALRYMHHAARITSRPNIRILALSGLGDVYENRDMLDSAMYYQKKAYADLNNTSIGTLKSLVPTRLGVIYDRLGNHPKAFAISYFSGTSR